MEMVKAYLAFGSNLGNKIKYIKAAYALLERSECIYITKKSGFYFSKAYGGEDLNDFVNSVAEIETTLKPVELLSYVKNIEKILGRKKLSLKDMKTGKLILIYVFTEMKMFQKKI